MLYQSWFYLTDFTFRLIHLTCVKSECYNPSYGTADNFTPAPIVEFLYSGTHIPYFLYFMSYSVGFSLVLPYMILTYIIQILSTSIYLSVYHTIYVFLQNVDLMFFQTCSQIFILNVMEQFQWVSLTSHPAGIFLDTNPNYLVYLSLICMTKECISFRPPLLFVMGGTKELQECFKFQFSGKI